MLVASTAGRWSDRPGGAVLLRRGRTALGLERALVAGRTDGVAVAPGISASLRHQLTHGAAGHRDLIELSRLPDVVFYERLKRREPVHLNVALHQV